MLVGDIQKKAHSTSVHSGVHAYTYPSEAQNGSVRAERCGMVPGSYPEVERMIEAEFGVGHIMKEVARAESRFNPTVWNCGSTASGVFQILIGTFNDPYYGCAGDRFNPRDNIACAKRIYDKSGTVPWNASKHVWGRS